MMLNWPFTATVIHQGNVRIRFHSYSSVCFTDSPSSWELKPAAWPPETSTGCLGGSVVSSYRHQVVLVGQTPQPWYLHTTQAYVKHASTLSIIPAVCKGFSIYLLSWWWTQTPCNSTMCLWDTCRIMLAVSKKACRHSRELVNMLLILKLIIAKIWCDW